MTLLRWKVDFLTLVDDEALEAVRVAMATREEERAARIAAGGDGEEEDAPEATRTTYDEADAIDFM